MDAVWVAVVVIVLFIASVSYVVHSWENVDICQTGSWAVVTGATDGIGKSFSHELAELGMNVVLVSRNVDKLQTCAKEIEETFGVATKVIQADFTSLDKEMYARIRRELADLDVGVLVNNVGMNLIHPDYFHVLDERHDETFQNLINCNITSAVNMTRFVLSGMVERRRGLIINVSSVFAQIPSPFNGLYSASKSFLAKFSNDLALEYKTFGIHVHLLRTGFVVTKLSDVEGIFGFVPDPKTYVKSALRQTAFSRDSDGYFGHWLTRMVTLGLWAVVPFIMDPVMKALMSRARQKRIVKCEKCLREKSIPIAATPWKWPKNSINRVTNKET